METINVRFVPHVLDEPPLDEVIRSMAIGEIPHIEAISHQVQDNDDPMFPHIARGAGDQNPEDNAGQDEEEPQNEENANPEGNADTEGQANTEENIGPQGNEVALPRVRRRVDVD